jgi:hypothetical protein
MAGRLQQLKTALFAIEDDFAAAAAAAGLGEVRVHKTRPLVELEPPAIYNVLGDSPADHPDWGSVRDAITLVPRLCVPFTDSEEYEPLIDDLGDLFADTIDVALQAQDPASPLRDLTTRARRQSRRERTFDLNGAAYLVHEFPITFAMRSRTVGPDGLRP